MAENEFVTGESNPADFTVDQVNAHLASADQAERDRVLALESGTDGKDRSTVQAPAVETKGETFQEAAANVTTSPVEAYRQGYFGEVPSRDGDNPEDLTLQGVLKRQNAEA